MNINDLSLEEKIGQMCMVSINSDNIDILYRLIMEYKIGGIILYKKNYSSYEEMLDVIKKLKVANSNNKVPLFISIDQEGGRVNRMPLEINNIRNIYDLSSLGDIKIIRKSADVTSRMLVDSGINMCFGPVFDIYNGSNNNVLYRRCFSTDVDKVSEYGTCYMRQMQHNNLISVIKHFPGHGSSSRDSHFLIPYIKDYKEILDKHIIPFENAIKNGCDAIMVGHLVIKNITDGLPASISRSFISKYLRERYNFDGLVITDDIKMSAVNLLYKFSSFEKAFCSGSDIILFKYNNGDEKQINRIVDKVRNGSIDIEDINSSVERIIKVKKKYRILDDYGKLGCNVTRINNEINEINDVFNRE